MVQKIAVNLGRLIATHASQIGAILSPWKIAICVACAVVAFSFWPHRPNADDAEKVRRLAALEAERTAIRRVLAQSDAVKSKNKFGFLDKYYDGSEAWYKLTAQLNGIDLRGCPQDFEIAFRKDVAAHKRVVELASTHMGLSGILKGAVTMGASGVSGEMEAGKINNELRSAALEMQESAIRHGVPR